MFEKTKLSINILFLNLITLSTILSLNNVVRSQEANNLEDSVFYSKSLIKQDYMDSKNGLDDYIIDSGDELFIEFTPAKELNTIYKVNSEGEVILPKLYNTFVRGLTISELSNLLEEKYSEYLIEPYIKVFIVKFRDIRVSINGEVKSPGIYIFKEEPEIYKRSFKYLNEDFESNKVNRLLGERDFFNVQKEDDSSLDEVKKNYNNQMYLMYERQSENLIKISDAIRKAKGITPKSDLSNIEIIRNIPIGKGGGKKRAIIDLTGYLDNGNSSNDIRLFDGDQIKVPVLNDISSTQIPKSIMSGLSPKFISVNIFGKLQNPGVVKLPSDSTLSDAIDLTGPIRPLSGKIILIRYSNDGSVLKKNISYSANARRGSTRNPYIQEGDFISVKDGLAGKSAGLIKGIAEPFIGIKAIRDAFVWE